MFTEWIHQQIKKPRFAAGLSYNLVSQPVSRVLSWIIIRLGLRSLLGSSNLPGSGVGHTLRNPIWSCSGWSLPCHELLPVARCALTAPFHPYLCPKAIGGLLSVALVVGSRLPAVSWHPALWSPDFPPPDHFRHRQRLSGRLSAHYTETIGFAQRIILRDYQLLICTRHFSLNQSNLPQCHRLSSAAFPVQAKPTYV
jgi:hypothetical protein